MTDIGRFATRVYLLVGRLFGWTTPACSASSSPPSSSCFDRHLATTKEWFPHQHIPYGRGRDYDPGETWTAEQADLGGATIDDAARSSLIVNLLTEDNLPYYFRTIERQLGADGAWGAWARRWTAEEMRHSMAIYGYLMVTRAVDPVALERSRMCQVSTGQVPEPDHAVDVIFYVALQELATRIAHRNTGRLLGDGAGYDVMIRVAADENLHYLFYRDLAQAAIELDPSRSMHAIERQVVDFEMPGTGIPGFAAHAGAISRAGIYDLARSTTTRSSCRSCCATGASSTSPASTPRPSAPATACWPASPRASASPAGSADRRSAAELTNA